MLLGGGVNVVSAARSAGRRGRAVHVLPQTPGPVPAAASRYVTSCMRLEPGDDVVARWTDELARLAPSVVVPCGDVGVELLATRRVDLRALGHLPAEGDDAFLLAMLDKQSTYELADAAGVERPATRAVDTVEQACAAAGELGYPCGLKPQVSHAFSLLGTGCKGFVVRDDGELRACLGPLLDAGARMLVTEVVPGPDDAYCSYYGYVDAAGRELLHYTKRKLRQHPVRFGSGTYHLSENVPDAATLGRQFFASAGLRGLGNVEFKRDERDGRLRLIECNPRLTAAAELVRRSGVDLTEMVYAGALGRAQPAGPVEHGRYQWLPLQDLRALAGYRREGTLTTRSWARSLVGRQTLPVFALSDPGPSMAQGVLTARRAVRRGRGARRATPAGASS